MSVKETTNVAEKRILVISSDPKLLGFLHENLSTGGYRVEATEDSGRELDTLLDKVLPDLIILDIMMPKMNGIKAGVRIRQMSEVPIIMLTTWNASKDKVRALDLNDKSYLTNPFGFSELMAQVKEASQQNYASRRPT